MHLSVSIIQSFTKMKFIKVYFEYGAFKLKIRKCSSSILFVLLRNILYILTERTKYIWPKLYSIFK